MNAQTKHTPGPWRVWIERDGGRIAILEVCETQDRGRHQHFASIARHWPEAEANARLIAAAPELLGLLQELIDIEGPQPGTAGWADKARAAIQRATGEQP